MLDYSKCRFRVVTSGTALPHTAVENSQLAEELGVDASWIEERCGVRRRYISGPCETTLSLAVEAAGRALEASPHFRPEMLICATFTPERLLCPTSPAVVDRLGLGGIGAYDLNGACAGGAWAIVTGIGFLASRLVERILLVCTDTPSKFLACGDRNTRILMADGAAALGIEFSPANGSRMLAWTSGSNGAGADYFCVPAGGSAHPHCLNGAESGTNVQMLGQPMFRFAVETCHKVILELCRQASVCPSDIDWVISHQANLRIIQALQSRTGICPSRWVVNIGERGNTASASIALAFAESMQRNLFRPGDHILIAGFGAGLTWAGCMLLW